MRGYRYAILDSPEDGETTATPRPQPLPPGFGPSPPTVSTQLNHIRPPRSSKTPGLPSRVYSAPPFKGAVVPPPVISSSSGSVPAMPTSPTLHNPSVVPVEPRTFVGPAPPGWRPPSPDPPARPRPPRGGDIRLHLGNLPLDITLDEVSNLFQHAGVSAQDIYLRTRSGSRSAYALVSSRAEYARASAVLHRSTLRRHKLYLERNSPRERSGAHPLVCVRGVPRGAEGKEEGHLAMLARACRCGAYGEVLDPRTGEGTFRVPSPASAQQAVDYLHGKAVQVGRIGAEWRTGEGATPDAPTRGLPSALVAAGGAPGTAPPHAAPASGLPARAAQRPPPPPVPPSSAFATLSTAASAPPWVSPSASAASPPSAPRSRSSSSLGSSPTLSRAGHTPSFALGAPPPSGPRAMREHGWAAAGMGRGEGHGAR
ncbi:hypothetical protein JCM10449v2_005025 [Rhodotorula kratochvilovae]